MSQIYLWESPDIPEKDVGLYNDEHSPKQSLFRKGQPLANEEINGVAKIDFEVEKARVTKYDCLSTSGPQPIVSARLGNFLQQIIPDEIQLFPVECHCSDGVLTAYHIVNVTHLVECIDHQKSLYDILSVRTENDGILGFKRLVCKEGCLGNYQIVREREYPVNILVSQTLRDTLVRENFVGVNLLTPKEFYGSIYPRYNAD